MVDVQDKRPIILCVDDDVDILQTLRLVLENNGFEARLASSAAEAMDEVKQEKPDLLIVDLMMEKMDSGTSLVSNIRKQGIQSPIYMLSAVGDELTQNVDTSTLGLDGVFQKPIDAHSLLATLRARLKSTK